MRICCGGAEPAEIVVCPLEPPETVVCPQLAESESGSSQYEKDGTALFLLVGIPIV